MKYAILLVAYGPATLQGKAALKNFDTLVRKNFPFISVRWAYSSLIMRRRLAEARQKSDSVIKALQRLELEKFSHIAVQSLQTICGAEYETICHAADTFQTSHVVIKVGSPLLASNEDVLAAANAVFCHIPKERALDEDVIFMGHGARHPGAQRYADLAAAVWQRDQRVHIGVMNGEYDLTTILPRITSQRVWLMPLLSVVGRHAEEDMAGPGQDSWRGRLEAAGHICIPVVRGLAESTAFAERWLQHLKITMEQLKSA